MTQTPELIVAGRTVRLGRSVGRGGEGEVYALAGNSDFAVKIYNEAKRSARESKVVAMVHARLASNAPYVAYPIEVARYKNGSFAGFAMKLVNGYQPIFELYSPGARKTSFPRADFRFLVRTATNVARAIASVHQSSCVIGDINHSGILVSPKATVVLIDADSFQVVQGESRYLCRVGVPEYTPPELHSTDLGRVVRTPNHDAFGLAVVIFQLLFMGRHPFVGSVRRGDVPKIDHAIRDFRFVYAENRNVGMDQPPGTPTLSDFTPAIAKNFELAFGKESQRGRPTAESWINALSELERSLTVCRDNRLHHYPTDAEECPWCYMDDQLGMSLFVPFFDEGAPEIVPSDPGDRGFNLAVVWRQIEAVKAPPNSALAPALQSVSFSPSKEAIDVKGGTAFHRVKGLGGVAAAVAIAVAAPWVWFVYVPIGWWGFTTLFGEPHIVRQPFIAKAKEAELQWQKALSDWKSRTGIHEFRDLTLQLEVAKTKYERLPDEQKALIANYRTKRREVQLHRYLDGFQIHRAKIRGVGQAKEATLASYGIATAADISREKVLRVPGFGPVTTKPLLEWRQSKERRFVYDTKPNALDHQEIARIRADITNQRAQARQTLLGGPSKRRRLRQKIVSTTRTVDSRLNAIHKRREQALINLKYLGIPAPTVSAPTPSVTTAPPITSRSQTSPGRPASQSATCPRCGSIMVKRLARRGRNAGNHFWGCSRFPRCKGTRNL